MRFPFCVLAIATLSVAGCATSPPISRVLVQYNSSPLGALVLRNGVVIGRTPFAIPERTPTGEIAMADEAACTPGDTVTFLWDSGAALERDACSDRAMLTATRPTVAPDLDKDLQVQARVLKAAWVLRPTNWSQEYERLGLQPANAGLVSGLDTGYGTSWLR